MSRYRIVVSAENNNYMAWQCKLFHYSCVSRLNQTPTFIVHEYDEDWHPEFRDIVRAGGVVRSAPSYATTPQGRDYPPRNTPGTLLHAAEMCDGAEDFIVLCDPDMLFVRKPRLPLSLSGEHYPVMDYGQSAVRTAMRRLRVAPEEVERRGAELCCGVPHVVSLEDARPLAEAWLEAIDVFPPLIWEISMYALGLAAVRLNKRIRLTRLLDKKKLGGNLTGDMIHYCYRSPVWSKHYFFTPEQAAKVWEPQVKARKGSILAEILTQINEAREYYARFTL